MKRELDERFGIKMPREEKWKEWKEALEENKKMGEEKEVDRGRESERIGLGIEELRKELKGKEGKAKEEIERRIDEMIEEYEGKIKDVEWRYRERYEEIRGKLEERAEYVKEIGEEVGGLVDRVMGYDGSVKGLEGVGHYEN